MLAGSVSTAGCVVFHGNAPGWLSPCLTPRVSVARWRVVLVLIVLSALLTLEASYREDTCRTRRIVCALIMIMPTVATRIAICGWDTQSQCVAPALKENGNESMTIAIPTGSNGE